MNQDHENKTKNPKKQIIVHMISDYTGASINSLSSAILHRLYGFSIKKYIWPFVDNMQKAKQIIQTIEEKRGLVISTIVDFEIQNFIIKECKTRSINCMPLLLNIAKEIEKYLDLTPEMKNNTKIQVKKIKNDESYLNRIESVNYAISHDDGQGLGSIELADAIIVGASRTAKTPTCIYLAHQGYRVANIPFINKIALDQMVKNLKFKTVIGLIMNPLQLSIIRSNRTSKLGLSLKNYSEIEYVEAEMRESKQYFLHMGWEIIDTTNKSIEEIAANIVKYINIKL